MEGASENRLLDRISPAGPGVLAAERAQGRRDLILLVLSAIAATLISFLVWEGLPTRFGTTLRILSTGLLAAGLVVVLARHQHARRLAVFDREIARHGDEVQEARTLLQLVVDNTPASLIVLDPELRIVEANRTAQRVHKNALFGTRCFESLAGCSQLCRQCPAVESFDTGRPSPAPRPHTDPRTGEVLSIESHPFDLPNGRRLVLLVERVVTEQKKLQVRLAHQERMAAFGLLAAGISHDLGNPLSSIEAQLQLLNERELNTESASVFGTVKQEVARLRRLLRELVDFARRRRDEATLVSVECVTEDALRLLRHDPRMRRVQLTREFDPETPPVFVVEDHLMQVLLNLLINALDAMPEGGALRLEVRPAGSHVALRIHDSGVGMDRGVLARCFEPLFTTKPSGAGTGLGLSICRDILHSAGGGIELHSMPNKGTTAVVTLPAAEASRAVS